MEIECGNSGWRKRVETRSGDREYRKAVEIRGRDSG